MKCRMCNTPLKKRKTKPYTAAKDGHLYFDYFQCPKCKVNRAKLKEEIDKWIKEGKNEGRRK